MKAALALLTLSIGGCAKGPASTEQLSASLQACGIHDADIRITEEKQPAWFWSSSEGIYGDDILCVQSELADRGVTAHIYDKSITDGPQS